MAEREDGLMSEDPMMLSETAEEEKQLAEREQMSTGEKIGDFAEDVGELRKGVVGGSFIGQADAVQFIDDALDWVQGQDTSEDADITKAATKGLRGLGEDIVGDSEIAKTASKTIGEFTAITDVIPPLAGLSNSMKVAKIMDNVAKVSDEIVESAQKISRLDNYVPKKTVKAYKLFTKGEDGNLYPLFVDANTPVPMDTWLKANKPDYAFQAENGRWYTPSKETTPKTESGKKAKYDTGERGATGSSIKIPDDPEVRQKLLDAGMIKSLDTKTVTAVASRPGWHSGDVPIAHHIGAKIDPTTGKNAQMPAPTVRRDDQVWAEVELSADVDWQKEALRRAKYKKNGEMDVSTAEITDMIPHGGSYRYKTNPNMVGEWLIGGELKVNRVLSDDEVKAINKAAGVEDLPRYNEFMEQYAPKAEMSTGGLMKDEYNRFES